MAYASNIGMDLLSVSVFMQRRPACPSALLRGVQSPFAIVSEKTQFLNTNIMLIADSFANKRKNYFVKMCANAL